MVKVYKSLNNDPTGWWYYIFWKSEQWKNIQMQNLWMGAGFLVSLFILNVIRINRRKLTSILSYDPWPENTWVRHADQSSQRDSSLKQNILPLIWEKGSHLKIWKNCYLFTKFAFNRFQLLNQEWHWS